MNIFIRTNKMEIIKSINDKTYLLCKINDKQHATTATMGDNSLTRNIYLFCICE